MRQCRAGRLTPDQALYHYLEQKGQESFVPSWARKAVKEHLKEIHAMLRYLGSPEGAAWLREGKNLENLFNYLVVLLQ
jgi:hypothetical protein